MPGTTAIITKVGKNLFFYHGVFSHRKFRAHLDS